MKKYEELVEALRYCADTNCTVCPRRVTEKCTIDRLCTDAANAIEELISELDACKTERDTYREMWREETEWL